MMQTFYPLVDRIDVPLFVMTILSGARFYGMFETLPLFTWLNLNGLIKVSVSIGLGYGIASEVQGTEAVMSQTAIWLVVLLAKEVVIGSLLGLLLGLPVWAAQVAGDMLDNLRGANASNIFDPMRSEELTLGGQMNALIAMSCIVAVGGLPIIVEIVALSFRASPVLGAIQDGDAVFWPVLRQLLDRSVSYGILVAAPLISLLIGAEFIFALLSKVSRSLNFEQVTPAVKSLVYLIVWPLYSVFLYSYSRGAFQQMIAEYYMLLER